MFKFRILGYQKACEYNHILCALHCLNSGYSNRVGWVALDNKRWFFTVLDAENSDIEVLADLAFGL